jgi:uncharacterized protein (DUF2141 family)
MKMTPLFVLLTAAISLAQQPAIERVPAGPPRPTGPSPAEIKPEDLCVIEGKVANAATGEPVKKAILTIRRAEITPGSYPTSYTTTTDDAGKFGMKEIEPGRYRLYVRRTGFVQMEYGAKRPTRQGTTLTLSSGQRMSSVDFKLTPHGVIAGRVVDHDGEPLAQVQISTMQWRYTQRGRQLTPATGGNTNDLGEFRIFGLAPGRYYLKATQSEFNWDGGLDRSTRDVPDEGYVPTYYPGTTDPASAAAIDITAGQPLNGVEIRLSKARTVRLRGRVNNTTGVSRTPIMVMLTARDNMFYGGMNRSMTSGTDARFEFRGLAPGSYQLTAIVPDGQSTMSGQQPVEVGTANIENIVLNIVPGTTMSGEVKIEGAEPGTLNLTDLRVSLRPREQFAPMYGPQPNDRAQPDGTFTLKNVPADNLSVYVMGMPEGFYLKSARIGDQDVLENGISVTGGPPGVLRLVVAPGAAQVDGSVTNDKNEPLPGATVVALPEKGKPRDWSPFQYGRTATTDQHGRFSLKNLDPGDYRVYSWDEVEYGAWMDSDFMNPIESKAKKVSLREGGRETAELKAIPSVE